MSTTETKPEFDGKCAFAVSLGKRDVPGNSRHTLTADGRTYVFSNPVAKFLWRILPGRRRKAEANWQG